MAGMIEKKAKTPITIKQPTGSFTDGKPEYSEVPGMAMFFDFSQRDLNYFGSIKNGKIFLVAPLATDPILPGKIIFNNKEYDLKAIKTYRNTKSEVLGYRCAVAGA
jgi:hypothetical protein